MDLTRRFTRGYSHRPDKAYQPLNKAFAMTRASVNPACGNNFILQRRDCLQLGTRGGSSNQDWRDKGRNLGIVAFFNRILRNRVAFAKTTKKRGRAKRKERKTRRSRDRARSCCCQRESKRPAPFPTINPQGTLNRDVSTFYREEN